MGVELSDLWHKIVKAQFPQLSGFKSTLFSSSGMLIGNTHTRHTHSLVIQARIFIITKSQQEPFGSHSPQTFPFR